ncbi:hypothetical protein HWV62_5461, partial [Athelia sp. TMB]
MQDQTHIDQPAISQISGAAPEKVSEVMDQPELEPEPQALQSPVFQRPRRQIQLPARYKDFVPDSLPDEVAPAASPSPSPTTPSLQPPADIRSFIDSARNRFGLYRRFTGTELPTHDPESRVNLASLTDAPLTPSGTVHSGQPTADQPISIPLSLRSGKYPNAPFHPFNSESALLLAEWHWADDASSSEAKFARLVDIVGAPTFNPQDIRETNWPKMRQTLGHNAFQSEESQSNVPEGVNPDAGWRKKPIVIDVPFHRQSDNPGVHKFAVGDLYHRSLLDIITEKLQDPADNAQFHYEPYELRWQPRPDDPTNIRVQGEFYASPAFYSLHQELQAAPNEPGCSLPKVVLAMQFSSDATQLAHFGTAKLWPLYLYFLNESKYRRCKPTENLCNHVAYLQSLPDSFNDFVAQHNKGQGLSKRHATHCRRELYHAQWDMLIDDKFVHAYVHGIVVTCGDGIMRRFYPRIPIYAVDYPEKVLVASICDKGQYPCPRCLLPITEVEQMGTPQDTARRATMSRVDDDEHRRIVNAARKLIYEKFHAVDSKDVEKLLKATSSTPTANTFSRKLGPHGYNICRALLSDFMHEVELGVWKGLLVHLLRILEAHDKKTKSTIKEFNKRFRLVPSFGRDAIRCFKNDVSELKQLAARDYEDLLQCCIPVFDGLLPEPHNTTILFLLFTFGHWHGLAKLRMHTDLSVGLLESETEQLFAQLRHFADTTCAEFDTHELRREAESRQRAKQRRDAKTAGSAAQGAKKGKGKGKAVPFSSGVEGSGPQKKSYHLSTIKHHFLCDYPQIIREFGTTDNYTTEPSELEHKRSKLRNPRTSHKKVERQLAGMDRRAYRIRRIRQRLYGTKKQDNDDRVPASSQDHHFIGKTENEYLDIGDFIFSNKGDPYE